MNISSQFQLPRDKESGRSRHGGHRYFAGNPRRATAKQHYLLLACLLGPTIGVKGAVLRYVADADGSIQHYRKESLVAHVSANVTGSLTVPLLRNGVRINLNRLARALSDKK